ncbi:gamma-glutamylcyclotransferase family protein [Roseovarius nanhaiticus]|uniref:gamma-glutamylcyclotransferase family protein n=1 Tax=Roseovarius nanhaiticus TaxID=573024 RepID=UPI00248F7A03|nr:gamma-glutamylcyclotransferase family protein [Roseovarius nanhaiticus]
METAPHAYFFGYGSLVNRGTHDFTAAHPARLKGWRRRWRPTNLREVAFLSVVEDTGTIIDGLIAPVPDADWHALDLREGAYDRVPAEHMVEHPLPHRPQIAVYAVPGYGARTAMEERGHHLLLSYIDVVIQGYLREFGPAGAQHFFDTTDGWEVDVIDDRAAPRYPRACTLTQGETDVVDAGLASLPVRMKRA